MKKNTHYTVQASLIGALYCALTYAQAFIAPATTSGPIQFRVSEILTILSLFTPAAIPGLTVGCIISNIANISVLPLDVIIGSLASLIASWLMYIMRDIHIFKVPLPALLMPALVNGIIVGAEIEAFFIAGPFNIASFLIQFACVAAGELGVCIVLGIPFYLFLDKSNIKNRLFRR